MPSQRASRWSAIEHHPYFWQLLLTALFSKFVASGIVIHIKHLQLSRSTHALNHWHTACTGGCWNYQVLLPELSNMSYAIIMVVAYIIAFTIIEVSWQVEQLCDDIWRSRIQGAWLAKGIGLAWRLAIPGTLAVVLAQAVAITNSQREGDLFWLSVITAVFADLIWPLQSLVMTTRDARIKRAATSLIIGGSLQRLADAFIVVRPRHIPTDDVCPICYVSLGEVSGAVVRTQCGHFYCKDCIAHWVITCKGNCPLCTHNIHRDLLVTTMQSCKLDVFLARFITKTTVGIWEAITMPLRNWRPIALSLIEGFKCILAFLSGVLRFVIRSCRFVMIQLIYLIDELAEEGAAESTKEDFDTIKASLEHLVAMMQAQSSQITELQLRQAQQTQELKAVAELLERLHAGTIGAAAASNASASEGDERRVHARLTAA